MSAPPLRCPAQHSRDGWGCPPPGAFRSIPGGSKGQAEVRVKDAQVRHCVSHHVLDTEARDLGPEAVWGLEALLGEALPTPQPGSPPSLLRHSGPRNLHHSPASMLEPTGGQQSKGLQGSRFSGGKVSKPSHAKRTQPVQTGAA